MSEVDYSEITRMWDRAWRTEIGKEVQALGFEGVSAWLQARPGVPYKEVLRELPTPTAPFQLKVVQFAEAKSDADRIAACKDAFVRSIAAAIPNGWDSTNDSREQLILQLSSCRTVLERCPGMAAWEDRLQSASDYILTPGRLPSGWRPMAIDDRIISEAFLARTVQKQDRDSKNERSG